MSEEQVISERVKRVYSNKNVFKKKNVYGWGVLSKQRCARLLGDQDQEGWRSRVERIEYSVSPPSIVYGLRYLLCC